MYSGAMTIEQYLEWCKRKQNEHPQPLCQEAMKRRVEKLARALWLLCGSPSGRDLEIWLKAESLLCAATPMPGFPGETYRRNIHHPDVTWFLEWEAAP